MPSTLYTRSQYFVHTWNVKITRVKRIVKNILAADLEHRQFFLKVGRDQVLHTCFVQTEWLLSCRSANNRDTIEWRVKDALHCIICSKISLSCYTHKKILI